MNRILTVFAATAAIVSAGTVFAQKGATGGGWEISGTKRLGYFGYGFIKSDGTPDGSQTAPIANGAPAFVVYEFSLAPSETRNAGMSGSPDSCRQVEAEFLKQQKSMLQHISMVATGNADARNFLKPTPFPQPLTAFLTKPQVRAVTVEIGGATSNHIKCFYTYLKDRNRPFKLTVYGTYKR